MSTLLNPNLAEISDLVTTPDSAQHAPPTPVCEVANRATALAASQSHIGRGLCFIGEFTGSDPLFIDGKVEGRINLAGGPVTVGCNGWVDGDIQAREIVVLGRVRGTLSASQIVHIRREGSVTGQVVAARINIEDGAFFSGGIDTCGFEAKQ